VGILTAVVQFLKYKDTPRKIAGRNLLWPTVAALVVTVLIGWLGKINYDVYGAGFLVALFVMLFASVYAVIGNSIYIFSGLKGKLRSAGASIAHIGFGLILLGILISASKREVISIDRMKMLDGGFFGKESKENPRENLMLPRNFPVQMGEYHVTYAGDSTAPGDPKTYYMVRYEKRDPANGATLESFTLYPDAFINTKGQEGLTPNPSSRHYLTRDIFTYVTAVPRKDEGSDTAQYSHHEIQKGDSVFFSNGYLVYNGLLREPQNENYLAQAQEGDLAVGAQLAVYTKNNEKYDMEPVYFVRNNTSLKSIADTVHPLSLYVRIGKILPNENKIELEVKEAGTFDDYIVLKAFIFPFINVLWIGVVIMIIGFVMSIYQRVRR
jgi:cytochrome c-type biogenesis protein CcmF